MVVLDEFDNIQVKCNPIMMDDVISKSNEKVTDIEKPKDKILLVISGRLNSQKGYDNLLEVCHKLNKDGLEYELWILGEGWGRPSLEELIDKYNLDNVKLLGYKENPYKYIKMGDLFVCSSRNEGFSLVIGEAMILGLPIISNNCSGQNELLDFGKYGMLVDNSIDGLYNGLSIILRNKNLINEYRLKSMERYEFFDYKNRISDICLLLD